MIRVISGIAKGRKLKMVPGMGTRPISDRVKEALFNIIGKDVKGSTWLDLFAGTGSVGIEALSRGAKLTLFIDNNRKAVETIKRNLEHTKLRDKAVVIKKDAFNFYRQNTKHIFDYVYIAPPQYKNLWKKAIAMIDEDTRWLNQDAWLIVQIHPKEKDEISLMSLIEFDQRRYGNTMLIFYKRSEKELSSDMSVNRRDNAIS